MAFFSKTVAERTAPGQRQTIEEQNNVAHVYNSGGAEQLAGEQVCFVSPAYALIVNSRHYHWRTIPRPTSFLITHEDIEWFHR